MRFRWQLAVLVTLGLGLGFSSICQGAQPSADDELYRALDESDRPARIFGNPGGHRTRAIRAAVGVLRFCATNPDRPIHHQLAVDNVRGGGQALRRLREMGVLTPAAGGAVLSEHWRARVLGSAQHSTARHPDVPQAAPDELTAQVTQALASKLETLSDPQRALAVELLASIVPLDPRRYLLKRKEFSYARTRQRAFEGVHAGNASEDDLQGVLQALVAGGLLEETHPAGEDPVVTLSDNAVHGLQVARKELERLGQPSTTGQLPHEIALATARGIVATHLRAEYPPRYAAATFKQWAETVWNPLRESLLDTVEHNAAEALDAQVRALEAVYASTAEGPGADQSTYYGALEARQINIDKALTRPKQRRRNRFLRLHTRRRGRPP